MLSDFLGSLVCLIKKDLKTIAEVSSVVAIGGQVVSMC